MMYRGDRIMNDVQKRILNVYKNALFIFKENDIPFYAAGGTALGAVRHRGFVPWDDDMDLLVPIEYMDKLRETLNKYLPPQYLVYNAHSVRHTSSIWDKIHDINTTNIEYIERELPDAYHGVWVDIVPIISLPNNFFLRELYVLKIRIYKVLNYCLRYSDVNVEMQGKFILVKKILKRILKKLPVNENYFYEKIFDSFRKKTFKNAKWRKYFLKPSHMEIIKKSYFKETVWFDFKDTKVPLPKHYDKYLIDYYGDFMKYPQEGERVSPHYSYVDLSKSYLHYRKEVDNIEKYFK